MNSSSKDWIVIDDNFRGYRPELFNISDYYKGTVDSVLISAGLVEDRTERLAYQIHRHYAHLLHAPNATVEPVTVICTLKAAYKFFDLLLSKIQKINSVSTPSVPMKVDFIRMKSYENDASTGSVKVVGGDNLQRLKGKHVLVVEDIVDTGLTISKLVEIVGAVSPKTLSVASLLLKRTPKSNGFVPDFVGFEVPDHFVVGFGIDFNESFRDLEHVCIISELGKKRFGV